jgi:PAS domain S-box-containing protein
MGELMLNEGLRILQVDDDPMQCEFMRIVLKRKAPDFEVTSSEEALQALELIKTRDYDCVISDYQMPVMNGLELLKEVRKLNEDLPFVFLTGQGNEQLAVSALRAGANDYFTKDDEFAKDERLIRSIRNLVATYKHTRESKHNEQQLRKLYKAMEQISSLCVITDREGRIEYINPACSRITGYSFEELQGKKPSVFKSGDHPDAYYSDLWKQISSGQVWNGTFLNRKKDGSTYWESASIAPVYDNAGEITHFIKVARDITESNRLNDEVALLLEKREVLEDIINNSNSIALNFQYSESIKLNYVSQNINEFGVSVEDLLSGSSSVLDIFKPQDQTEILKVLNDIVVNHSKVKHILECRIAGDSGKERWVEFTFWPRKSTNGRGNHFQALIREKTLAKRKLSN